MPRRPVFARSVNDPRTILGLSWDYPRTVLGRSRNDRWARRLWSNDSRSTDDQRRGGARAWPYLGGEQECPVAAGTVTSGEGRAADAAAGVSDKPWPSRSPLTQRSHCSPAP